MSGDIELGRSMDTSALIKETRRRLGLTQEKFAAKLGVTLPTVNRWENGRTRPSPLAIQNLRELISSMGESGNDLMARCFSDKDNQ
jgi:DNA-binding transcriptional regulator YiaG